MSLEWWRSDDVSILCEEAACELDTVLRKTLLEGVRLPHELQWDKSTLLWGNEERSQNVISLVISRGVHRDSLVGQTVESLPAMWETQVGSLEKEMTTHSSMLAWKIPWVEEPGGLQSIGPQRIRHDGVTSLQEFANFRKLWVVCGVMVKNNWLKTTRFLSFFISRQETFSPNWKKVVFPNWENLFWESCTVLGITKSTQPLTNLHSFVVRKLQNSSRRR